MKNKIYRSTSRITIHFLLCSVIFFSAVAHSEPSDKTCAESVGNIASLEGIVEIQRTGQKKWNPAGLETKLCENDSVRVGRFSRAAIALINDAVLRLKENTTIRLTDITGKVEEESILDIIYGVIQSFSRQPHKFAVNTPYLNGSIEGTEFLVEVVEGQSTLTVLEGKVRASNEHGEVMVKSGEAASAKPGQAPTHRLVVHPRNAVQWAMYYPPVLAAYGGNTIAGKQNLPGYITRSVDLASHGQTPEALAVLEQIPVSRRDESYFVYHAAILLSIGMVEQAERNLQQVITKNPKDSNALALQSVIAITRNQNSKALELSSQAVEYAPDSSTALIALSYAQQARFNNEGARATLEKAVELEPDNALVWARLATLYSSFGQLDKTLEAAQKAAVLAPDLSRTQTVLGFAYLTQIKITQAKAAFQKAIELSQADPLPRLGLGLAMIREGDLKNGGREIEIAVNLDPNKSIYRSYLGKTYYEQKRDSELVDQEYATAKELDPNDPTPYFYSAIENQTTNRPVEALHDMQKAIELNDNRAVYRSKLLLDSDLASRSAAIARVYTDLGFQQRALVEGWNSVNTDPASFSAHRLLADSYSALPRHEIARVSELLQSQLLQPINMTPIQPRLAESNLFLISAGGPGTTSFNEFNPMFNSDGLTFQASGMAGENDTYSGEGILAGIFQHASFSFGYSHFQTDGWRENADQKDHIGNAFVQFEITPDTSIQAEYRIRDTRMGDILQRFFEDDFFPAERRHTQTQTVRAGLRHNFTPDSIMLASFIYQDFDENVSDDEPPETGLEHLELDIPNQQSISGELQHLFRSHYVNLTSGIGYSDVDGQLDENFALGPPIVPPEFSPFEVTGTTNLITRHLNVYSYAQIQPLHNLTGTIGLSYDNISGDFPGDNTDQWNPKFGITWEPIQGTTFRAAAFKVLKRTLVTNQTLEPTQVAGFNQFYDDLNLTEGWRYGGAIDQVFTRNIYGGLEFSMRDLNVPYLDFAADFANPPTETAEWDEYLGRAYLFWTPHDWVAFRAEYQFERFQRDKEFTFGVVDANTHRVPFGFNFFHPSGFSSSLTATYINQDGQFENLAGQVSPGDDSFWTVDLALNYRLPKRYGFITLGGSNLFNEKFEYFDSDMNNPSIVPGRLLFGRVTLQIP